MTEEYNNQQDDGAVDAMPPKKTLVEEIKSEIKNNIRSGATVALVNLPLSISLAVASQALPISGVRTAIWAGMMCAAFGGSQFNIVGPTGALSGLLSRYSVEFDSPNDLNTRGAILPWISLVSSFLIFLVFFFRVEKYVMFLPASVNQGFTLGVAFIISANQLNSMLGINPGELTTHGEFRLNLWETLSHLEKAKMSSLFTAILFFVVLFTLSKHKKTKKIPWVIVICIIGIIVGASQSASDPIYITLQKRFGTLSADVFNPPVWKPSYNARWFDLFSASVSTAFVAVLETLISGKIADGLARPSLMNSSQEVFGLAIGNLACGVAGGLPATAALARTSLNIRMGAVSRVSGFLNTCVVLLISIAILPVFSYLPMPVIAAMLVMVAFNMVEWHAVGHLLKYDKIQFVLTLIVAVICIIFDPTMGIVFGGIVGLLRLADHTSTGFSTVVQSPDRAGTFDLKVSDVDRLQCYPRPSKTRVGVFYPGNENDLSGCALHFSRLLNYLSSWKAGTKYQSPEDEDYVAAQERRKEMQTAIAAGNRPPLSLESVAGQSVVYRFLGELTFVNGFQHYMRLRKFDQVSRLILHFKYCYYIDVDGWENVEFAIKEYQDAGGLLLICGLNPYNKRFLSKMPIIKEKQSKGHVFQSWKEALAFNEGDAPREEDELENKDGLSAQDRMNLALGGVGSSDNLVPEDNHDRDQ